MVRERQAKEAALSEASKAKSAAMAAEAKALAAIAAARDAEQQAEAAHQAMHAIQPPGAPVAPPSREPPLAGARVGGFLPHPPSCLASLDQPGCIACPPGPVPHLASGTRTTPSSRSSTPRLASSNISGRVGGRGKGGRTGRAGHGRGRGAAAAACAGTTDAASESASEMASEVRVEMESAMDDRRLAAALQSTLAARASRAALEDCTVCCIAQRDSERCPAQHSPFHMRSLSPGWRGVAEPQVGILADYDGFVRAIAAVAKRTIEGGSPSAERGGSRGSATAPPTHRLLEELLDSEVPRPCSPRPQTDLVSSATAGLASVLSSPHLASSQVLGHGLDRLGRSLNVLRSHVLSCVYPVCVQASLPGCPRLAAPQHLPAPPRVVFGHLGSPRLTSLASPCLTSLCPTSPQVC